MRIVLIIITLLLSCNKERKFIIDDYDIISSSIDEYIDNGSLALLHVYLENYDGSPLYSYSKVNDSLVGIDVDENTWFRIWSMSKIVTISIAMDLVEEGIISLNDDVSDYFPELKNLKIAKGPNGEKLNQWISKDLCPLTFEEVDYQMTISDLILHKAGFFYSTTNHNCLNELVAWKNLASSTDTDDFIKRISQLPLIQEPGDDVFYGVNTTILGMVCEKATGKTLNELLNEKLISPFNIKGFSYNKNKDVNLLPVFSGVDSLIRKANKGELDIYGQDVPNYEADNKLFLGGEGMIATTNGYADFLRIILNDGSLEDIRFLDKSTIKEMSSPHVERNEYGYNGYNLWVTSDKVREDGHGDSGLWTGGGYEGTHFWIDRKRKFVGLIMTQVFSPNKNASNKDNEIRGLIYNEIFKNEK